MDPQNPTPNAAGTTLTPKQEHRLSQWMPSRQDRLKRLWQGKGGRKLAIQFQCLDCTGEDIEAVRTCGDLCCPLWHFRPFQTAK